MRLKNPWADKMIKITITVISCWFYVICSFCMAENSPKLILMLTQTPNAERSNFLEQELRRSFGQNSVIKKYEGGTIVRWTIEPQQKIHQEQLQQAINSLTKDPAVKHLEIDKQLTLGSSD